MCLHILEFISFTQVSRWTGYVEPSDSVGADHFGRHWIPAGESFQLSSPVLTPGHALVSSIPSESLTLALLASLAFLPFAP